MANTLRRHLGIVLSTTTAFLFVAFSGVASAQSSVPPVKSSGDLQTLFCNIINWMIWILLAVAIIMIVMAAFNYVTAGDDAEKITKGRKTLTYAAIGIAVVLLAKGFPLIVASVFPNSATANSFNCGAGSQAAPEGTLGIAHWSSLRV